MAVEHDPLAKRLDAAKQHLRMVEFGRDDGGGEFFVAALRVLSNLVQRPGGHRGRDDLARERFVGARHVADGVALHVHQLDVLAPKRRDEDRLDILAALTGSVADVEVDNITLEHLADAGSTGAILVPTLVEPRLEPGHDADAARSGCFAGPPVELRYLGTHIMEDRLPELAGLAPRAGPSGHDADRAGLQLVLDHT